MPFFFLDLELICFTISVWTVASRPVYRFPMRTMRCSRIPIYLSTFNLIIITMKSFSIINEHLLSSFYYFCLLKNIFIENFNCNSKRQCKRTSKRKGREKKCKEKRGTNKRQRKIFKAMTSNYYKYKFRNLSSYRRIHASVSSFHTLFMLQTIVLAPITYQHILVAHSIQFVWNLIYLSYLYSCLSHIVTLGSVHE